MGLKAVLIVLITTFGCVGCSDDEVDSSYSFDVNKLKATVTDSQGKVFEKGLVLLDSLQRQEYVGEVKFSEESRAENDRLAEEKFQEKCLTIKNIKPGSLLELQPGESVVVTFDYVLKRGRDLLKEEKITLQETIPAL